MDSMFNWLARLIDRMDNAGIEPGAVALKLNSHQDKILCEEVRASCGMTAKTAHGGKFMGWDIVVTEESQW